MDTGNPAPTSHRQPVHAGLQHLELQVLLVKRAEGTQPKPSACMAALRPEALLGCPPARSPTPSHGPSVTPRPRGTTSKQLHSEPGAEPGHSDARPVPSSPLCWERRPPADTVQGRSPCPLHTGLPLTHRPQAATARLQLRVERGPQEGGGPGRCRSRGGTNRGRGGFPPTLGSAHHAGVSPASTVSGKRRLQHRLRGPSARLQWDQGLTPRAGPMVNP